MDEVQLSEGDVEPLRGHSLLFTTQFPGAPSINLFVYFFL